MVEDEYFDRHKAALAPNTITERIFAYIDNKGPKFLHLDAIDNHRVNGEEVKHKDDFIISHYGGKRRREITKG